ncbi:uncharacterized protein STEHIDRAFT_112256 [Stereum hirsutum FP-91666 SS1]|uniref:uncharacterized protein n=1 Tax=Stereum hirsutum (strain FP-91666) TaxID=721885 RepID=UPI0004449B8B|nr:uncharacterized protein STEHIDRAFT_112256 [Stereum hirsutum FP-91666 SS1]EIM84672.1 hypothetical protein STEHIDRAFT_112256 [Stereum hirsutum FP-91666 SS1]
MAWQRCRKQNMQTPARTKTNSERGPRLIGDNATYKATAALAGHSDANAADAETVPSTHGDNQLESMERTRGWLWSLQGWNISPPLTWSDTERGGGQSSEKYPRMSKSQIIRDPEPSIAQSPTDEYDRRLLAGDVSTRHNNGLRQHFDLIPASSHSPSAHPPSVRQSLSASTSTFMSAPFPISGLRFTAPSSPIIQNTGYEKYGAGDEGR